MGERAGWSKRFYGGLHNDNSENIRDSRGIPGALEERLKNLSQAEQVDINRLRRQIAFDRLLARLFRDDEVPWALKGGYALELRFKAARSTIDIDLTLQRVSFKSTITWMIAFRYWQECSSAG